MNLGQLFVVYLDRGVGETRILFFKVKVTRTDFVSFAFIRQHKECRYVLMSFNSFFMKDEIFWGEVNKIYILIYGVE